MSSFNSLQVESKEIIEMKKMVEIVCFNSLQVESKVKLFEAFLSFLYLFQFLIGRVKSQTRRIVSLRGLRGFNSLQVESKALLQCLKRARLMSFNSLQVESKGRAYRFPNGPYPCFNSLQVESKEGGIMEFLLTFIPFQFLIGRVKSHQQ